MFKKWILFFLVFTIVIGARVLYLSALKKSELKKKTLFAEVQGQGSPAILLLHGMLASHRYWTSVIPDLSKNQKVIATDLLGFGNSPKPPLEYSVEEHISYLQRTLKEILPEDAPLVVIGHSMGAILALNYSILNRQRVKGIILINAPIINSEEQLKEDLKAHSSKLMVTMTFNRLWGRLACFMHELYPPAFVPLIRLLEPDLPAAVAEDATLHDWDSYSGSFKHVLLEQKMKDLLLQINEIPILIIGTDEDSYASKAELDQLQLQANVKIKIFQGKHNFLLNNSEVIIQEINRFIRMKGFHI